MQKLIFMIVLAVFLSVASPTLAWSEQSQSQRIEQSAEVSITVNGETVSESKSSSHVTLKQSAEQSQTQVINANYEVRSKLRKSNGNGWRPMYEEVRLSWNKRGGTCHIRYKEANSATYNYRTSTSCDEGGITIGGLKPGTRYRFQVQKDGGRWMWVDVTE